MLGLSDETRVERIKRNYHENQKTWWSAMGATLVVVLVLIFTNIVGYAKIVFQPIKADFCTISDKIAPPNYFTDNSTVVEILHDPEFRKASAKKLQGAVQIDTQVFDNAPDVDEDPELWSNFDVFHRYLQKTFPRVYLKLKVETVNTYGLVFTWKGTNSKLKPLLLTAHQDTVPIAPTSLDKWSYPPLDGHYDGKKLWGRGSLDNKNVLISLLESVDALLGESFIPTRTVVLGFGFDEEISGDRGAANIAKFLIKEYGKDSFYAIVDEGPGLMKSPFGDELVAMPATGEKGHIDIIVALDAPGGHSLNPPAWTSIGVISDLMVRLEEDPYDLTLGSKNPFLKLMQCGAVNSSGTSKLKTKALLRAGFDKLSNSLVVKGLAKSKDMAYMFRTTQAIDIIEGGIKANALPEHVEALVNHRIAVESSVHEVQKSFAAKVREVAEIHGLGLKSFGKVELNATSHGTFVIEAEGLLEPAPVTPSAGAIWDILAGSTRHVYEDLVFPNISYKVDSLPSLMVANTDTKWYWPLTKHIFRYTPAVMSHNLDNVHTVDENIDFDNHLRLIAFWFEYIQNVSNVKDVKDE